jgi:hypothetical protein
MKKLFYMSILVFFIAFTGCEKPCEETAELTAEKRTEIAQAIKKRNQELLNSWAKENAIDEWMSFYVSDNHESWAIGGSKLSLDASQEYKTEQNIRSTFTSMLADRTTNVKLLDEHVAVLSSTSALHFSDFTFTVTRAGETSESQKATATTAWVLDDGKWKILHYHQSWSNED